MYHVPEPCRQRESITPMPNRICGPRARTLGTGHAPHHQYGPQ